MKLKLFNLVQTFLIFLIFSESNYKQINDIQITSGHSFVKLKLKLSSNPGEKSPNDGDEGGSGHRQQKVRRVGSPPSSSSSNTAGSSGQQSNQPRYRVLHRMSSWPPEKQRTSTGFSTRAPPKPISERYSWPPSNPSGSRSTRSRRPSSSSPVSDQSEDREDLYTAIRVLVREDTPLDLKDYDSGSESDSNASDTSGGNVDPNQTDSGLSPEDAEKMNKLKDKYTKSVELKLSRNKIQQLLQDVNLGKKMLFIPVSLLVALLEKILLHLTANLLTIITAENVKQMGLFESSGSSASSTSFDSKVRNGNQNIEKLRQNLGNKFSSKYRKECNSELLSSLAESYKIVYLEKCEVDLNLSKLSNPRETRIQNRSLRISEAYSKLGELMRSLRRLEVEFLECFLKNFEKINPVESQTKKSEVCTWKELSLLYYFLTVFKGYSSLTKEALKEHQSDIKRYEDLRKNNSELTELEKQELAVLSQRVDKLLKLRTDNELFDVILVAILVTITKCLAYLKSETN